jgi:hypothetical protein
MTTEPLIPNKRHVTINSPTPSHITSLNVILNQQETDKSTNTQHTDITGNCICLCNNESSPSARSVMLYSNNSAGRYEIWDRNERDLLKQQNCLLKIFCLSVTFILVPSGLNTILLWLLLLSLVLVCGHIFGKVKLYFFNYHHPHHHHHFRLKIPDKVFLGKKLNNKR